MSTETAPAGTAVREDAAARAAQHAPDRPVEPAPLESRAVPVTAPPAAGWRIPLAVLIGGMFMSILDVSIVNVAIATIQSDFGGSTADVAWVTTAYSLVLGVVVPASAWLGDRFGLDRVYMIALAGFALGSALCGLAWSLDSLIAFRVIQAIPGGLLPAVTLTMVYRIVPRHKIGTAMGMYGLGIVFAPAIGPTLGGYLVEYLSWRLVFYINVPVGVLGLVAAAVALPKFSRAPTRPFDVWGFITVATGLVALLLAFSEGQSWGWTSYRVLILIVGGLLSLALFVTIELEVDHPLLNLKVFHSAAYTTSLIVMSVVMTGMFATLFYIPLFLQAGQGYQALDTGLLILPQALVMGFLMPITGRLYDKIGPRWLVVSGLLVAAFGSYGLAGINPDMTREEIVMWTCIRAAGVGLAMMPIMTGGLASLGPDQTNSGSAINTVVQRVSAALGLAALTALATAQQAQLAQGRADLVQSTSQAAHLHLLQLFGLYRRTQVSVLANSYANLFLLTAAVTAMAAVGALFLRSGPASHASSGAGVTIE
ncbi:MAG TPA: DHA2 family efflux MFS transporter permease subunit [Propionibacteriaceae bacterium]